MANGANAKRQNLSGILNGGNSSKTTSPSARLLQKIFGRSPTKSNPFFCFCA
tara:strand:+ start:267 stop:422 length:156 start_codon:yes stop_codon:yes gene_type:complete